MTWGVSLITRSLFYSSIHSPAHSFTPLFYSLTIHAGRWEALWLLLPVSNPSSRTGIPPESWTLLIEKHDVLMSHSPVGKNYWLFAFITMVIFQPCQLVDDRYHSTISSVVGRTPCNFHVPPALDYSLPRDPRWMRSAGSPRGLRVTGCPSSSYP